MLSIPLDVDMMERVWRRVEEGAASVGRTIDRDSFHTATLSTIVVLEAGERPNSERVRAHCGAFAIASLHYAYDQWRRRGAVRDPGADAVDVSDR